MMWTPFCPTSLRALLLNSCVLLCRVGIPRGCQLRLAGDNPYLEPTSERRGCKERVGGGGDGNGILLSAAETDRQPDKQTDRQTDRQTGRQREREREREREKERDREGERETMVHVHRPL